MQSIEDWGYLFLKRGGAYKTNPPSNPRGVAGVAGVAANKTYSLKYGSMPQSGMQT